MPLALQKNFEGYEKFVGEMTKVLVEGPWEGATRFFIAGDLNIEPGPRCTDDDEEMHGPQCWHGTDTHPGRFKKTMWLEGMTEINCKEVSAWWSCNDQRERASTDTKRGKNWNTSWERKWAREHRTDTTMSNCVVDGTIALCMLPYKKKRSRAGWKSSEEGKIEFKKIVMGAGDTGEKKGSV